MELMDYLKIEKAHIDGYSMVVAITGQPAGVPSRAFPHGSIRELYNFTSVVLPGKSHLTAISAATIPKLYIDLVGFINSHDQ